MLSPEKIHELIYQRIAKIKLSGKPVELYEPISYTLTMGGKRLRPAMCLLACDLFAGEVNNAVDPAIGIEIFHNFTLVHDDIMDQAPIRRGKPTVYKKWNRNIAILSGDTMMALAYEYIMKAPERVRSEVFSVFNKTAIEVCEGQQYDMNFETNQEVKITDYIEMIRLKTAVLLAASLKIGALIGGAGLVEAEKLYSFGEYIGIAFQLKDDLLDAYSDEVIFGKIKGGDIITNKKTYLYLKALEVGRAKDLDDLRRLFSAEMIDHREKIKSVLQVYEKLNLRQLTEFEIMSYYEKAVKLMEEINVEPKRKKALKGIADQLNDRNF
jgi:geranylgeranyl diphosphate synthase, type II